MDKSGATLFRDFSGLEREPHTLIDILGVRASNQAGRIAYTFLGNGETEESSLTYRQLDQRARTIGARLQSQQRAGDRILLLYPAGLEYVAAFFGCLYAGVVAVPAYPPRLNRNLSRLQTIVEDAGIKLALTTSSIASRIRLMFTEASFLSAMRWLSTDEYCDEAAGEWREPSVNRESIAVLQYTSGSTGAPKGVMLTHGNLLHNSSLLAHAFRYDQNSHCVSWLPAYHDMGLIGGILQPLYGGFPCTLMSPAAFLQRPLRWLQAISKYGATISGGPNFAYDLCVSRITDRQKETLDLSKWTTAFCGAEPIRAETLDRFCSAFEVCGFNREAFSPCYGLAEATLIVSGGRSSSSPVIKTLPSDSDEQGRMLEADSPRRMRRIVGCGECLPDQKILIVDPRSSTQCESDHIGEIWVAGPSVAKGYFNRPVDTEETFRARLAEPSEGVFLRTGDLGMMSDGELFVTGRLKDLIIIRGLNHYPQDLEYTVELSHPALRSNSSAAFSIEVGSEEGLVVVCELEYRVNPDFDQVIGEICNALASQHDLNLYAVALIKAGTIPRTSSGKIQRRATRSRFLEGSLEVVHERRSAASSLQTSVEPPPPSSVRSAEVIQEWLRFKLAVRAGIDPIEIDVNESISRYGLSSLTALELQHGFETEFGVEMDAELFLQGHSLAELATRAVARPNVSPAIEAATTLTAETVDEHPLSYGQKALWFQHQLDPESPAYNIMRAVRIDGDVKIEALHQAFQSLMNRHACLRTTYVERREGPMQRVHRRLPVRFEQIDATGLDDLDFKVSVLEAVHRPFDLVNGPVWRISLFHGATSGRLLVLTAHHITIDLWSLGILTHELGEFYRSHSHGEPLTLTELPIEYTDYVRWEAERLSGSRGEDLWDYWRRRLDQLTPELYLPTVRRSSPTQARRGASITFTLDYEFTEGIKRIARRHGATLYVTLLAAFKALLYRYSGQDDISIGSPTTLRSRADLAGVVGYFVNPIVLRSKIDGGLSFEDFLGQVRQTVIEGLEHRDLPLAQLVERLQPNRESNRSPLFQIMFAMPKMELPNREDLSVLALGESGSKLKLGGLSLTSIALEQQVAQFDLSLNMIESPAGLMASIEYDTTLFTADAIQALSKHFETLLAGIIEAPNRRLGDLAILSESEGRRLLSEWNTTRREYPSDGCLHELFEAQVENCADRVAVVFNGHAVTYGELNCRANQLAHHLRRLGSGPETLIAVLMDRTVEMIVALLGVLKSGGAYLALDVKSPRERLDFMLRDAGAKIMVTSAGMEDRWAPEIIRVVAPPNSSKAPDAESEEHVESKTTSANLAYLIYTSGSTGQPKAVAIQHHSASVLVRWAMEVFNETALSRVLASTSITFDLSVFEIFVPLSSGGSIILVENVLDLIEVGTDEGVTLVNTVPSAMSELLRMNGMPERVEVVNLAGEALPRALVDRIYRQSEVREVWNLYGPSEDTTYTTGAMIAPTDEDVVIGRPIANTEVYILDERLNPAPAGVVGELCISGDGLARGYLKRAGLTAERFFPDQFGINPGGRMYGTGDLCRRRKEGDIEYLGRKDYQVKLRGYRIELGEIEAKLRRHAGVREAVVVVAGENEKRLVAYIVGESAGKADTKELREYLRGRLPEYMTPSTIIELERMPLTPNGKLDRKALPQPTEANERLGEEIFTPVEELVGDIWREVLKQERFGLNENFFELGGHSLLATQVVSRVREIFGVDLGVRSVFEGPTVRSLAKNIEQAKYRSAILKSPLLIAAERNCDLPLSFAQRRLWFLEQLDPESAANNISFTVRLRGELHEMALLQSLREIVRRHEILRTRFSRKEGRPVQIISDDLRLDLEIIDLTGLSKEGNTATTSRLIEKEARRPFDLTTGRLLRLKLLRSTQTDQILLLTMHHIISDGWSMTVMVKEVTHLYEAFISGAPSQLEELPIQYADFAIRQQEWLSGEILGRGVAYWKDRLKNAPVSQLPTNRPRSAISTRRGRSRPIHLSNELVEKLKTLGRREGTTLFMTLLAALQTLVHRYSGEDDVVVATPIANRNHPEIEGLIGFFVNMLVLRADLSGAPGFLEVCARVRDLTLEAYAHQDVPFEKLVEELKPDRASSPQPMYQIVLALNNGPQTELSLHNLTVETTVNEIGSGAVDLAITLFEVEQGIKGWIEYNAGLFEQGTISRFIEHYGNLLTSIVENPDLPIGALDLLSEAEKLLLSEEWNGNRTEDDSHSITQLFELQVSLRPEAIAVAADSHHCTYAQLNARANTLAAELSSRSIGVEQLVAVCAERSIEMIIGLVAILKTGAAYVPMDPHYPEQRLSYMLLETGAQFLLTKSHLAGSMPESEARMLCLDSEHWQAYKADRVPPSLNIQPQNLAYIIYTSGSSGRPKGVQLTHVGLENLCRWHQRAFDVTPSDRATHLASASFDASVWEIWPYITAGAVIYLVDDETRSSPERLQRRLIEAGITIAFLPTPLAESMLDLHWPPDIALRTILTGGDTLHKYNRPAHPFALINNYGPTENTVVTTSVSVGSEQIEGKKPSIGRPIDNVQVYLLDHHLNLTPVGVAGELYIAGEGTARGYVKQSDLTAERFQPHPFSREPGARIYRTGDLARYDASSQLEFLGRADHQIKVRGYRIEIEEIETVLSGHEGVRQVAVDVIDGPRGKFLVAYVSADPTVSRSDLAGYLRRRLPEFMAPTSYLLLESLPVRASGKIDRAALKQYRKADAGEQALRPENLIEELLGEIWKTILCVEEVRMDDNFFELGGHSLLATELTSQVREVFGVELEVRTVFEEPTVARLAEHLRNRNSTRISLPPIKPVLRHNNLPLSFAQHRLWFLDQLEQTVAYHIAGGMKVRGALEIDALERTLNEIERRHESLRTTLVATDGQPMQVVNKPQGIRIELTDINDEPPEKKEEIARTLSQQEAQRRFDLAEGPLLRVKLLKLSDDEHILLLTMHHIIGDGWSLGVLCKEIEAIYNSFVVGRDCPLEELSLQYADYACWQREWLRGPVLEAQLEYWRDTLQGELPALDLPADRSRKAIQSFSGNVKYWKISHELTDRVRTVGSREGATPFMIVLAAFNALLHRYSGHDEIIIGSPTAGRNRAEIQPLIGFFANTLALRTKLGGDPTFAELARRVREVTLGAYLRQDVPFEMVVEAIQPERSLSHTPLFQVMIAWQSGPEIKIDLKGVESAVYPVETGTAKFELVLAVTPTAVGMEAGLEYSSERFDPTTIERIQGHFNRLLEAATADPQRRLSELPLLSKAELEELISWNETEHVYPDDQTIQLLFEAQARRTPEKVAVICGEAALSYRELNRRADQLARYLGQFEVGPERLVGICAERNLEMIIAIFGTLKAGGAYVGLDPAYPRERLAFMLADAKIKVLLTHQNQLDRLPATGVVLCLDRDWPAIVESSAEQMVNAVEKDNLAYLIYTSGSTGKPKGVSITHRNAVALIHWAAGLFNGEQLAGTLASTSICFDLSAFELFVPLTQGGAVILVENLLDLPTSPAAPEVTLLNTVPSAITELLMTGIPASVQTVNLAGEPLPNSLVQQIYLESNATQVWNLYGPSEDTTYSSYALIQPGVEVEPPIGRPINNTQIYILDRHLQSTAVGVIGELYITGDGLARGYLERPELTALRFIPNPFSRLPGTRMYVTGDRGCYRSEGNIEYCGRSDHQIKIRGFRIEVGEIEAELRCDAQVRDCAVVPNESDRARLIAYIVPEEGEEIELSRLRRMLGGRMPNYMIPSDFVVLGELPLTPNGKVDRRTLSSMGQIRSNPETCFVAPRTSTESVIAAIWEEVLDVPQVGVHDNFFDLGGHSLIATRIMARIESIFQVKLALRRMFETPTVSELSFLVDLEKKAPAHTGMTIQARRRGNKNLEHLLTEVSRLSNREAEQILQSRRSKHDEDLG